jgi:hypothetical protein
VAGYGAPIYTKLAAFPAFYPMTVTAVCDWSIQAGDIVTVTIDDVEYSLPIYVQTIAWKGDCRVTYESTGNATRQPVDAMLRELFRVQAASEGSVRQGVMYNNVRVSHAEGFVAQATINGEEVTARFNAGELGFYNSAGNLIGGMAVTNGVLAMIAGILANEADGNCYATIGNVDMGGYVSQGIFLYRKDYSTSSPIFRIVGSNGGVYLVPSGPGWFFMDPDGSFLYADGSGDTPRISTMPTGYSRLGNDDYYFSTDEAQAYMRAVTGNHAIGVDTTGPYYVKNGSKTYF